jgi:hypothetical protein
MNGESGWCSFKWSHIPAAIFKLKTSNIQMAINYVFIEEFGLQKK